MFIPFFRLATLLLLFTWYYNAAASDKEPTAAQQAGLEQLIRKLGDDSYQERERAYQKLLGLGLQAKAALLAGMKNPDLEISVRCRRLWDEVRILAGWQDVRIIIGDSRENRALYDKMFQADPTLWYELAENLRPVDSVFSERRAALEKALKDGMTRTWLIEGSLANIFYFGIQAKRKAPQLELKGVEDLLNSGRCQQALRENAPLQNLWEIWAKITGSEGPALDRLMAAMREDLPKARGLAREMLEDQRFSSKQRQYALLALAKVNNPADDALIQKFIDDASPVDVYFSRGVLIKSQLRDIALAALIVRADKAPSDFGFKYLRRDERMLFSPSTLGFKDDDERRAAFKKWLMREDLEKQ